MGTTLAHVDHLKQHARSQSPYEEPESLSRVPPEAEKATDESPNEYRKKLRPYQGDNE